MEVEKRGWGCKGLALGLLPSAAQSKRTFAHIPTTPWPPHPTSWQQERKKEKIKEKEKRGRQRARERKQEGGEDQSACAIAVVFKKEKRGERKKPVSRFCWRGDSKRRNSLSSSAPVWQESPQDRLAWCVVYVAQKQFHNRGKHPACLIRAFEFLAAAAVRLCSLVFVHLVDCDA